MNTRRKLEMLGCTCVAAATVTYFLDPTMGRQRRQRLLVWTRRASADVADLVETLKRMGEAIASRGGIGGRQTTEPPSGAGSVATGAETLLVALGRAREAGFAHDAVANEDGTLRCTTCDRVFDASELVAVHDERLEGASDAADLLLLVAGRCPRCGVGVVLVLGYGPNAGDTDVAVLTRLDTGGATPFPPSPGAVSG